jgi:hypothetical protein
MFNVDPRAGALDRQARYAILDTLGMEKTILGVLNDRHVQKSMLSIGNCLLWVRVQDHVFRHGTLTSCPRLNSPPVSVPDSPQQL